MNKKELLEKFEKLNADAKNIDCNYCDNCDNCENCVSCNDCNDCYNCYDCNYCNDCYNCYGCNNCDNCNYCNNCILCKNLKGNRFGYWLLNEQVTREEFEAAKQALKGE